MKVCECGCGMLAPIQSSSHAKRGYVKGEAARFVSGHNAKGKPVKSYRLTRINGRLHPAHRMRAERALGKPLPVKSEVHHADGSRNENAQLVICEDRAYHQLLHVRMRIKASGGNPNTDAICTKCKSVKPRTEFSFNRKRRLGIAVICRKCASAYHATHKAKRQVDPPKR